MRETKEKKVEDKIFNKENIRSIWSIVNDKFVESGDLLAINTHSRATIMLTIICFDGTKYESDLGDMLADGEMIDLKKVESVNIDYQDYTLSKMVSVTLSQNDYASKFIVKGQDRNWVAGTFGSLDLIFNSVKPQSSWFNKYKIFIMNIMAFLIGFTIYKTLDFVFFHYDKPLFPYPFILIYFWSCGIFISMLLTNLIERLWPSIEFDFGPEHEKLEKNRRNKLGLFISIVIIPFIINLIYGLIMNKDLY